MIGIGTILKFCQHLYVAINFERIVPDFFVVCSGADRKSSPSSMRFAYRIYEVS